MVATCPGVGGSQGGGESGTRFKADATGRLIWSFGVGAIRFFGWEVGLAAGWIHWGVGFASGSDPVEDRDVNRGWGVGGRLAGKVGAREVEVGFDGLEVGGSLGTVDLARGRDLAVGVEDLPSLAATPAEQGGGR